MIYAFGPWELDTRLYELRNRGAVTAIEPQVFDVLVYLVANRDRVVSKEELLEKVWPDRIVAETTLTSRLKAARRAVGDDGKSQAVIRTHHGRGYRFVADVRVLEGQHVVAPSATPLPSPRPPRFVGRDAELARLDAALGRALGTTRQIVFIAAEAGAGKTTLAETFVSRLQTPSILVARGQCIEHRGTGEPYMPLLDAFGRLCRHPDGSRIVELLRESAPAWLAQMPWLLEGSDGVPEATRQTPGERMLREFGMAVERIAAEAPLVLLLEDLHWSDSATLDAIELIARQTHPARVLLIGTYRPSDGKISRHPVAVLSQELRARGLSEIVDLPLLAVRELEEYVERRFPGGEFISDLAGLLHERTSGNPLYAANLVDSWITRGLIANHEGSWRLEASLEVLETGVPDSLQHLIERRIADIEERDQRMLETASVIGREFPVALLAAVLGEEDDEIEQRCEALARDGRFLAGAGSEVWGDGRLTSRFAFTHDLYVDVLYERIPEARRVRTHHQAGLLLERTWDGRHRERAAELAAHFQRALDATRAIRYLELAAEQAGARSAYREAVLHYSAALDLVLGRDAGEDRDAAELRLRAQLAPALVATRGWADTDAERHYQRAIELARTRGDRAVLSRALYGLATMYEYRGEFRTTEEIVRERITLDGEAEPPNTLESHELLACSMLHQGRYREALEHASNALSTAGHESLLADPVNVVILVQAHGWMSGAEFFTGSAAEAMRHNDEAIGLAERRGDEFARATALIQAALIRYYDRDAAGCLRLAGAGSAIARERRLPFHVACGRTLLGWCASQNGRHEEALREIRAGIRTSISIGARMDVPLFLVILAEAQANAGDTSGAIETLDEAFARVGRNRSYFYLPEIYRTSAEIHLARGDRATAAAALERALAIAREQESPHFIARSERLREQLSR